MADKIDTKPPEQPNTECLLSELETAFPKITSIDLHEGITQSPFLKQLSKLIQLSIPIEIYPLEVIDLYEQITTVYYQSVFRIRD